MQTLLPEWNHLRLAPEHVLRGLRAVDQTADLIYQGWGKWLLVSVRPTDATTLAAQRIVARAQHLLVLWESDPKFRANPGAYRRLLMRYEFALAAYFGARPIAQYAVQGEPTSAIVDDFRRMDWLYRNTSDQALEQMLDEPKESQRSAAHADLTDPARGREGWRYLFTQSHWVGDRPGRDRGPRSGFARQPVPSTLTS